MAQSTLIFTEDKTFRKWDRLILDWDIEFKGYSRGNDNFSTHKGVIHYHMFVQIYESYITIKNPKNPKKKSHLPGYILSTNMDIIEPCSDCETWNMDNYKFEKKELKKAYDQFRTAVLDIQSLIAIAESRVSLIPYSKVEWECPFCGWVTDKLVDDITCRGCWKRFWSDKLLR